MRRRLLFSCDLAVNWISDAQKSGAVRPRRKSAISVAYQCWKIHKKGTPSASSPLNSLTLSFTWFLSLSFPLSPFFLSIKVILSVTLPLPLPSGRQPFAAIEDSLPARKVKKKKKNYQKNEEFLSLITKSLIHSLYTLSSFFSPAGLHLVSHFHLKNFKHNCLDTVIIGGIVRKSATASACIALHTTHHYQLEFMWGQRGFHFLYLCWRLMMLRHCYQAALVNCI